MVFKWHTLYVVPFTVVRTRSLSGVIRPKVVTMPIHRTYQALFQGRDGASAIHQLSGEEPRQLVFVSCCLILDHLKGSKAIQGWVSLRAERLIEGGEGVQGVSHLLQVHRITVGEEAIDGLPQGHRQPGVATSAQPARTHAAEADPQPEERVGLTHVRLIADDLQALLAIARL